MFIVYTELFSSPSALLSKEIDKMEGVNINRGIKAWYDGMCASVWCGWGVGGLVSLNVTCVCVTLWLADTTLRLNDYCIDHMTWLYDYVDYMMTIWLGYMTMMTIWWVYFKFGMRLHLIQHKNDIVLCGGQRSFEDNRGQSLRKPWKLNNSKVKTRWTPHLVCGSILFSIKKCLSIVCTLNFHYISSHIL